MSECRSANKRQRTNATAAAAPVPGTKDYLLMIGSLPIQMVCNILADAARQHPDVAESVVNVHSNISAAQQIIAEQGEPISFDRYLQSLRTALSNPTQIDPSSSVAFEVYSCIEAISKATGERSTSFTKKSALKILLKMGKRICYCSNLLGLAIRSVFDVECCLQSTMLRIAKSMTVEDRSELVTQGFVDKLVELDNMSTSYFDFNEVEVVLRGKQESSDGETGEDETDGEDDSESSDEADGETDEDDTDAEEDSESNDKDRD